MPLGYEAPSLWQSCSCMFRLATRRSSSNTVPSTRLARTTSMAHVAHNGAYVHAPSITASDDTSHALISDNLISDNLISDDISDAAARRFSNAAARSRIPHHDLTTNGVARSSHPWALHSSTPGISPGLCGRRILWSLCWPLPSAPGESGPSWCEERTTMEQRRHRRDRGNADTCGDGRGGGHDDGNSLCDQGDPYTYKCLSAGEAASAEYLMGWSVYKRTRHEA